jgi:formamidopyrimidine-DNA glycosylase
MPELPEVETVVRDLSAAQLIGQRITRVQVFWPRSLATHTPLDFSSRVQGQAIQGVARRAKFIILQLSQGTLLIHLRMTGRLYFSDPQAPRHNHEHLLLDLSDRRQMRFQDARKFGRWYLYAEQPEALHALGPEPLDRSFKALHFAQRLAQHQRQIKPLLLDQTFIAGLGNIYADEALFEAGIHPLRRAASLSTTEAQALFRAIRTVLKRGIANLGTTLGKSNYNYYSVSGRIGRNQDALRVFRRMGKPCPRCSQPIARIIVGQRSTHLCLTCQRA